MLTTSSTRSSAHMTGCSRQFLLTLHFYIGILVGPFLFIVALSGLLYALTPQLEKWEYAEALHTQSQGQPASLAEQALAARQYVQDSLDISAIRPAPEAGDTTRIMFADPTLGASENRTIFIDPITLAIKGDMVTYGTEGLLPLRTLLDYVHRGVLLGDWGRYYSEVAASWLGIMALGGLVLWASNSKRQRSLRAMSAAQRRRWLHATLGALVSVALLFFAITGLTWSQAAGDHITQWRNAVGWVTPAVSLQPGAVADASAHAEHHADHAMGDNRSMSRHKLDPALARREQLLDELDKVSSVARQAGLTASMVEIRLPKPGQNWVVREYDRRWPLHLSTIALDPQTLAVTSHAYFRDFPLAAKMIKWGVAAHLGIMFGLPNQLLVAFISVFLMLIIGYAYAAWAARGFALARPLSASWLDLPVRQRVGWGLAGVCLGWAFPAMGVSLGIFLVCDMLRLLWNRRHLAQSGMMT